MDALSEVRSWNAPAAMYFVISVFPISTTAGAFPPASVASSFCRWVPQVWYCTSTVTPGWSFWNWSFAAFTIGAQFGACASVWSQTVMLLADRADVEPDAVDAMTARAAPARTTAPIMRALMGDSPKRIERRADSLGLVRGCKPRAYRLLVYTTLPRCVRVAHGYRVVKTTLARAVAREIAPNQG